MTSIKVSLYAGFALALPVMLWQVWGFLAPAFEEHTQRVDRGFVAFASALFAGGVAFGYSVALPAAVQFLTNYDSEHLQHPDPGEGLLLVRDHGRCSRSARVRAADLRARRSCGSASSRRRSCAGTGGSATSSMAALAVALPGVDPVTTMIEMVPLMVLFEGSIWLAVALRAALAARDAARRSRLPGGDV